MSATHRRGPARTDQPAGTSRWLAALGQHPWYLAIMAVAAFGLVAGSVTVLVQANSTPSHQAAAPNCGLINCGAAAPAPSVTTSAEIRIGKTRTTVSHAPKPSASPTPSPSQAATSASPPDVTLTFTAGHDQRDFDHFQGQLTLVNQGASPVAGWTAELTLPGDEVFSVENQAGRNGFSFEHWRFDGDTLTMSADSSSETLSPGQPLSLSIHGRGRTTSPTGCTFNGAACPGLRAAQQGPQPSQAVTTSPPAPSPPQTAPSSPQTAPSSPQDQQTSPEDQQPGQDRSPGRHQRGQRSGRDDRQPSLWDWVFSGWR
jgi:hypothetical protein